MTKYLIAYSPTERLASFASDLFAALTFANDFSLQQKFASEQQCLVLDVFKVTDERHSFEMNMTVAIAVTEVNN